MIPSFVVRDKTHYLVYTDKPCDCGSMRWWSDCCFHEEGATVLDHYVIDDTGKSTKWVAEQIAKILRKYADTTPETHTIN